MLLHRAALIGRHLVPHIGERHQTIAVKGASAEISDSSATLQDFGDNNRPLCVVVGVGDGLGMAVVRIYVRHGWNVVAGRRNIEKSFSAIAAVNVSGFRTRIHAYLCMCTDMNRNVMDENGLLVCSICFHTKEVLTIHVFMVFLILGVSTYSYSCSSPRMPTC